MSKFNTKKVSDKLTETYEGALAYKRDMNDALINFLFGSYLADQYYETAEMQQERFLEILEAVANQEGYKFIGKVAHFARNEMGMRSISELAAAWMNDKPMEAKRDFYRGFFHRPDDVAEVFAAIESLGQKRSHAVVRGAADYLSSLNDYTLGKYKMRGKSYNMYDLINITHAHSSAIQKYKDGVLETPDTWEVKISGAQDDKDKAQEWKSLVEEGKLGYMALLRNLRNIRESGVQSGWYTQAWIDKYLVPQITDETAIKKSLVFPYRIYAAARALVDTNHRLTPNWGQISINLLASLDKAFRIAIGNMPELSGKSLVVLDISGSMTDSFSNNSSFSIKEICAVYAAAIYVNSNSKFCKFGTNFKFVDYDKTMNIFELINSMQTEDGLGYGTDIQSLLSYLGKNAIEFDRLFVFSDMQVMEDVPLWRYRCNEKVKSCQQLISIYYQSIGKQVPIYSFDCGNYHSQLTNPDSHYLKYFTGLNDNIMKFIELYESGTNIVDYINKVYPY